MPIRLLVAVLLLLGPMPFRSCTCAAEHANAMVANDDGSPADHSEPAHHDPDCPMAKAAHPKPAVTAPVATVAVDFDVCTLESPAKFDSSWPCLESAEPSKRDRSVPFWLVHLAIQI